MLLRLCDRIVAVSDSVRASMAPLMRADDPRMVTIRNGVLRQPVTAAPLEKRGFALVTVARLAPPKDHATLLRAVALAVPRIPDLNLTILGGGALEAELRGLASELKIDERVTFAGTRSDVGNWLARADVFVLSSRSEGLPIAMLEAMAAGLPMILSDVGGIRETVGHLPGVLLVPAESVEALESALIEFSRRRTELPALGEISRDYVASHFSAERMADEYERLNRQIL